MIAENLVENSTISLPRKEESENKKSDSETYAKIAARHKGIYLKRLHDFPKQMKKLNEPRTGGFNPENKFSLLINNHNFGKKF